MAGKLTHSLDTINSFGELKVVVPLNMSQIPGTLETLKARKQHYLDERAKVGISQIPTACFTPCLWWQGLFGAQLACLRHLSSVGTESLGVGNDRIWL